MTAPPSSTEAGDCRAVLMTALRPGAVAIIQLIGTVEPVLRRLTDQADWPTGRLRLASLGGIDEGIAGRVTADVALVCPHGGPRVVQKLMHRLQELGAPAAEDPPPDPRRLFPEARDLVEALMLQTLAAAASPLAVDLLLDQPARWRAVTALTRADRERSRRLDRLLVPPRVVLAGPPNVGKSTLSNALIGRSMSIALDAPGTTRDYTVGRIELAGLVVDWHDTPGLRETDDAAEAGALDVAAGLMDRADLLLAITDAEHDWPRLPRAADLRLAGKSDLGRRDDADLAVSGLTGDGIPELVRAVRDRLVPPEDLDDPGPWVFDERLLEPSDKLEGDLRD